MRAHVRTPKDVSVVNCPGIRHRGQKTATPNGALLVAYVPPARTGSITVDMGAMSGPSGARWFNPTNGIYTQVATGLANSGSRAFTPPGNNSAGQRDWVLVLDAGGGTGAPAAPTDLRIVP